MSSFPCTSFLSCYDCSCWISCHLFPVQVPGIVTTHWVSCLVMTAPAITSTSPVMESSIAQMVQMKWDVRIFHLHFKYQYCSTCLYQCNSQKTDSFKLINCSRISHSNKLQVHLALAIIMLQKLCLSNFLFILTIMIMANNEEIL